MPSWIYLILRSPRRVRHEGRNAVLQHSLSNRCHLRNSRFQTHLPIFKKYNVGAINWGLVSGKSNTIYQWSKPIPDGSEPELWFHDIFRKDGTPYDKKETEFIKAITAK